MNIYWHELLPFGFAFGLYRVKNAHFLGVTLSLYADNRKFAV